MTIRRHLRALAREERGIGLIELITVLAILGAVIAMTVTLFVSAMASEVDLTERVRAQEQARLALERLRREVHEACGVAPTGPASSVTLTMPAATDTGGSSPTFCAGATTAVTWCTRGAAPRFTLERVIGNSAACAAGNGVKWADFLTAETVFEHVPASGSSLATLRVDLPVDVNTTDARRAYRLRDALALRNSTRQGEDSS